MEKLLEILNDIDDSIDYETETGLIDNHIFDSFDIIQLVSAIDDEFDVSVDASLLVPENFNSAQAIYNMIESLNLYFCQLLCLYIS